MKRYFVPILLATSVMASGLLLGCELEQKEPDLAEYIDEVSPVGENYLETIELVAASKETAGMDSEFKAQWFKQRRTYIRVLKIKVLSLPTPSEATTFYRLALDSFNNAIFGLSELIGSYGEFALPNTPPELERLRKGYDLIEESLKIWGQASQEMEKLVESLEK